jgi:hypothetical protein
MRWTLSAVLCAFLPLAIAAPAEAADLNVTVVHRHKLVRVHHHRALRVVRDYDGTPITIRRRPDGTADAYVVERASPTRYLNGQPVTRWAMR